MDREKTKIPQLEVLEPPPNCPVPPPCPVCPPKPKPWQVCLKILLLLIAGLALAFVILVGSGLRIIRKESLLDIWLASKKSAPTAEPSPALDPTANWKTYTDEKYKYQFKYPSEWPIETHDVPDFPSNRITNLGKNSALIINVNKVSQADNRNCQSKEAIYKNQGYEAENILVGGNNAWRVALPGGQNPKSDVICLENNDLVYEISYSYSTLSPESEQKEIYTQILSTFKFLDQEVTTGWKEYRFEPLQLSLKVPAELTVQTEEPNPGNDFAAYIQNYPFNAPFPKTNAYQLYIIWQKTPSVTKTEFEQLKNDLATNTVEETTIGGYPAIKGQVKGERNRFVTYILVNNSKISLFTAEATESNRKLTDQILSTFKFLK